MVWDYEREGLRDQVRENTPRLAFAWGFSTTTGAGQLAYEDRVNFGLTFIERPAFSYGFAATALDPDELTEPLLASGWVFEWVTDTRGFYTGAHVGVSVQGAAPDQELEHHFSFAGKAWKDLTVTGSEVDEDEA